MDLSVVVPVFNEAENIQELHASLKTELESSRLRYELIFVDDGSKDKSFEILNVLGAEDPHLRCLRLSRNFGQTSALAAGIRGAKGEWIATLDGDLQNDPADILPLLKEGTRGFDIVSGWRKERDDPSLRVFLSQIANRIATGITGLELHDYGCSMKIYRKSTLARIRLSGEMHRFLPLYAYLKGARVTEKVVNHRPREKGVSKYGYLRILRVVLDMILFSFLFHSRTPLPYFSRLAIFFFLLCLGFLALAIFLGSSILAITSLLCFVLGSNTLLFALILELIIRTHYLSQQEAQYTIKDVMNCPDHPDYLFAGVKPE
jgi:glycosyltransferase involved in cell wall biosynthesis